MKKILSLLLLSLMSGFALGQGSGNAWTGTFATAVEYTGKGDMPQLCSLAGNTLREIVHVSIGGNRLRLQLSNEFGDAPVEIHSVYVSDAGDSSAISAKSSHFVSFKHKRKVTIPAGEAVWSDAFSYPLKPLQRLAITIAYGNTPDHMTSHRGSRTNSYIARGVVKPDQRFNTIEKLAHWYNIAKISVETPEGSPQCHTAIAVLGNSITDGRGSTTDAQDRWTDRLAEALGGKVGVLNLGIGGNCVVSGGLSQPALKRFRRDILGQEGIDRLIIFEGTNDIGCCQDSLAEQTARKLILAYQEMAAKAHEKAIKVYGATITPFKGNGWYSHFHEAARQTVNDWIRTTKVFDGVVDFDSVVRDPQHTDRLRPEYSDDWLHLNPLGYQVMGRFASSLFDTRAE